MLLIVQKYGGSSLATPERIKKVARGISDVYKKGTQLVVVVSAMGDSTDKLQALALQVSLTPSDRELDMLLSAGERISMSLLSMALHDLGHNAVSLTGSQSGIVTDTAHTRATILDIRADRIKEALSLNRIIIVAGFQGVSTEKEVTTLGRGGSDVTAVALAVKLGASRCEFYKDVDGVYTNDPKTNPDAKKIKTCHYADVMKLLNEGSGVFHRRAIELAEKHSLPLYLASTLNTDSGTRIGVGYSTRLP
jgi:aspartate kinase